MKILIAADMEGVTGVVCWEHVATNHPEYARFRKLMTEDVNAAIRGAFDAGADEVLVSDGHSWGRNILIEALDSRARLRSGSPSPLSMVSGVETGVDGVFFIGYHARIGVENAILEHTWSDERVADLRINGQSVGETALNAALCGHYGTPVLMVSGDQTLAAEAQAFLGDIETAVVKIATGRMSAECFPPAVTAQRIHDAAFRAVTRLQEGRNAGRSNVPPPLRFATPLTMEIDFVQSEMTDKASQLPGATREGRTIRYVADDILTLFQAFRCALALAR